ncbi:MAG: hypothetical protein U9R42_13970, partial [Bacteroidota bacterium]|nr:hypothetical protein [Bacteroidota bacterium]
MGKEIISKIDTKKFAIIILVLASFYIIVFQKTNIGFQAGHNGFLSSHGITIAKNLSSKHNFLMFHKMSLDKEGNSIYSAYNSFPITTFAIIKLSMLPFPDNLSNQIFIARKIILLFFCSGMFIAFFIFFEFTKKALLSLSVVLFSYSSFYLTFYNDMIFNDVMTLFACLLIVYGFIIYSKYGKFKQLIVKVLIGISFGWQVYALLFPYIAIDFFIKIKNERSIKAVFKSNLFKLAIIAFIYGTVLLGINLVNEQKMTGNSFKELSTFKSAKIRLGADDELNREFQSKLSWGNFIFQQTDRIFHTIVPHGIFSITNNNKSVKNIKRVFVLLSLLFCSIFIYYSKERQLLITLFSFGFIWSFPMRHFTFFHNFQSIYYIGISMIFYLALIKSISKLKHSYYYIFYVLLFSLITFYYSNNILNRSKIRYSQSNNWITNDFQNIYDKIGKGNTIFIDGEYSTIAGGRHAVAFYLSGNYIQDKIESSEYIIS